MWIKKHPEICLKNAVLSDLTSCTCHQSNRTVLFQQHSRSFQRSNSQFFFTTTKSNGYWNSTVLLLWWHVQLVKSDSDQSFYVSKSLQTEQTSMLQVNDFQKNYFACHFTKIVLWHSKMTVKFMFSKKATKIDKIFAVNLRVCSNRQIDDEDFITFCGLLRKHELYSLELNRQDECTEKLIG